MHFRLNFEKFNKRFEKIIIFSNIQNYFLGLNIFEPIKVDFSENISLSPKSSLPSNE